jgi:hypothetical protein
MRATTFRAGDRQSVGTTCGTWSEIDRTEENLRAPANLRPPQLVSSTLTHSSSRIHNIRRNHNQMADSLARQGLAKLHSELCRLCFNFGLEFKLCMHYSVRRKWER